jgi:hypothetical protein
MPTQPCFHSGAGTNINAIGVTMGTQQDTDYIWVMEEAVDATRGYRLGSSEPYESWFTCGKRLFAACQKDYGRCTSRMYVDLANGTAKHVGWVFQKLKEYEDADRAGLKGKDRYFLQEMWISLHKGPPQRTIRYQYL